MKPCDWDSKPKYEKLIEPLREEARKMGYALTVHGTLKRDIDLVACPWIESAAEPRELAKALAAKVAEVDMGYLEAKDPWHELGCPGDKPHGRLVWKIQLGGGPYIDLSVMPMKPNSTFVWSPES
jgi:hypothetical protein